MNCRDRAQQFMKPLWPEESWMGLSMVNIKASVYLFIDTDIPKVGLRAAN